jgi:hypothetical protein
MAVEYSDDTSVELDDPPYTILKGLPKKDEIGLSAFIMAL